MNVGTTVNFTQQFVVRGKVINEGTFEAQRLQKRTHLCLQSTPVIHLRPKWFWDAQLIPQHDHVHLRVHAYKTKVNVLGQL